MDLRKLTVYIQSAGTPIHGPLLDHQSGEIYLPFILGCPRKELAQMNLEPRCNSVLLLSYASRQYPLSS